MSIREVSLARPTFQRGHSTSLLVAGTTASFLLGLVAGAVVGFQAVLNAQLVELKTMRDDDDGEAGIALVRA